MDNLFRTGVLLAALTALFMAVGYAVGGSGGMLIALGVAAATILFARKIQAMAGGVGVANVERHPATAHLFIINPLQASSLARLFATHPATAEPARRLEAMAAARGVGGLRHWNADRRGGWSARRTA